MDDTKNLGLFARIKNYLPSAFSGGGAGSGKFFSATYLVYLLITLGLLGIAYDNDKLSF